MRPGPVIAPIAVLAIGALGCGGSPADDGIPIGVMLSYSGYLAANSANSERALIMAVEAANAAGGVGGRHLRLVARDMRSDPTKVTKPAQELIDAGAALFIGPDTVDTVTQLRALLQDRTMLLPSFATSSDIGFGYKPTSWFVMGAATGRVACELVAQLRADGRQHALVIANPGGYNSAIAWQLTNTYGIPKYILSTDAPSTTASVGPITSANADAYVLAAFPTSASSLVYALAALGAISEQSRWYLGPTLHTPAFLDSVPRGALAGAHGVAPGTGAGAPDFRDSFDARWHDTPLDDAYPFYDAGVIAALALQRAQALEGAIPGGTGLSKHILAVTHGGGTPVQWNEVGKAMALLAQRQEVQYVGLSGVIEFDVSGQTLSAGTKWWRIGPQGFDDVPAVSDCQ